MDNKVLGKGLSALISAGQTNQPNKNMLDVQSASASRQGIVSTIKTDLIDYNPYQPRVNYDQVALEELKASIKESGILQPILVRPIAGGRYQVVAGQRRLKASQQLKLESIPVVVKEVGDQECMVLALVENIQREELNPIEEANAFDYLIQQFKMTQDQIAQSVGKNRSTITNILRLLKLPSPIQDYLIEGSLNVGQARALLAIEDEPTQIEMARNIVEQGLSVRSVEGLAKQVTKKAPKKTKAHKAKDPDIAVLEEELRTILGTKVLVEDNKGKGKLVIEYYSLDDLDRVLNILRKK